VTVAQGGTYDVWANFWAEPSADWRIRAGLAADDMQVFRQKACEQVDGAEFETAPVLTDENTVLYQAYLGRVQLAAGGALQVMVDDFAVQTGTPNTRIGNSARTWYDGISYAAVDTPTVNLAGKPRSAGALPPQAKAGYDVLGRRFEKVQGPDHLLPVAGKRENAATTR
jgi:hypothetical protein